MPTPAHIHTVTSSERENLVVMTPKHNDTDRTGQRLNRTAIKTRTITKQEDRQTDGQTEVIPNPVHTPFSLNFVTLIPQRKNQKQKMSKTGPACSSELNEYESALS